VPALAGRGVCRLVCRRLRGCLVSRNAPRRPRGQACGRTRARPRHGAAMKYFWRALEYLRPYKRLAAGSIALIVCGALVALIVPWPLKFIVDNVLSDEPIPESLSTLLGTSDRFSLLIFFVIAGLVIVLVQNGLT